MSDSDFETQAVPLLANSSPRARATRALRESIAEGELAAGMELASESVLAERLGVSRGTIRAALAELEADGLVRNEGRRRVVAGARPVEAAGGGAVLVVSRTTRAEALSRGESHIGAYTHYGLIRRFQREGISTVTVPPEQFAAESGPAKPGVLGVVVFQDSLQDEPALRRLRALRDAGVPVAVGDPAETDEFDAVRSDHAAGSYAVTRWLLEHGRRRPLRWWALAQHMRRRPAWLAGRDAGHERACREAAVEPIPAVEFKSLTHRAGQRPAETLRDNARLSAGYLLERLAEDPAIDALVLSTDGEVRAASAAVRLCGREPERDVLIAGYDNYWADPQVRPGVPVAPAVTADKRNQLLGEQLAELLLDRAAAALPPDPQVRLVEPELIVLDQAPPLAAGEKPPERR